MAETHACIDERMYICHSLLRSRCVQRERGREGERKGAGAIKSKSESESERERERERKSLVT